MTNRKGRAAARWLGLYTGVFLLGVATLCLIMLRYGKTLVWDPDGVKQHYTVIGYVGRAVRDLLAGRGLPMMSFSLGQGMDLLTTCAYYGYTDPLSLLGAFASGDGIEIAYAGIAFLRAYLAGIFFTLYARRVGVKGPWALACAATVYVFSGSFVRLMGLHPYFLNGALYLPLLLLGVERVLRERKWLMLTLVTALMLIVNFYFAYMNTVAAVVYIVVRLIARLRSRGVKESAKDGFMLLGAYLLGAALSAAVFLPVARLYAANSRLGVAAGYAGSPFRYFKSYYLDLALILFAPWISPGNHTTLNFAPLALFGLLGLFFSRGGRARQVRVALYLCAIVFCVPLLGKVMNGMAYVTNRWGYIMALFAALGCGLGLPRLLEKKAPRKTVAALALIYAAGALTGILIRRQHKSIAAVGPALVGLLAVLLLVYDAGRVPWLTRRRLRRLMSAVLALSCALYVFIGYAPRGFGAILGQEDAGIYSRDTAEITAPQIEDDGVYRVAQGLYDDPHAALLDYMGTSYYWSLVDGENSAYYRDLCLPTQSTTYHIEGLGASSFMNAVAAVKYFVRREEGGFIVPYGYEAAGELPLPDGGADALYENAWALPLGYAYDAWMSAEDYDALPVEEKLQALVQRAIVAGDQDDLLSGVAYAPFEGGVEEIPFEFTAGEGVARDGNTLSGEAGDSFTLTFEAPEDHEVYLLARGVEHINPTDNNDGTLIVSTQDGLAGVTVPNPVRNFYFPKAGYAVCLGSGDLRSCEVRFHNARNLRFGDVRLVGVPLSVYREGVEARRAESMTDVALSNDRIAGHIAVAGDRVLQIAVPYSDGWSAWVDGERQSVFRCGGLYMGLALTAGAHEIEMRYETPGLRAGALISLAALALIIALLAAGKVRKNRRAKA